VDSFIGNIAKLLKVRKISWIVSDGMVMFDFYFSQKVFVSSQQ
jgi:hypothetical protein